MGTQSLWLLHLADVLQKKAYLDHQSDAGGCQARKQGLQGYGTMSNYIYYNMRLISKPILISEVVAEFLTEKKGRSMTQTMHA